MKIFQPPIQSSSPPWYLGWLCGILGPKEQPATVVVSLPALYDFEPCPRCLARLPRCGCDRCRKHVTFGLCSVCGLLQRSRPGQSLARANDVELHVYSRDPGRVALMEQLETDWRARGRRVTWWRSLQSRRSN